MRIKETKVYKYDELTDEAKEKAIEKLWDINVDSEWWDYDGKTGFSQAEITKYGLELAHSDDLLEYKKLYFDIDRGAYIQFIDAEFAHEETARRFLGVPAELWAKVDWRILDQPGRNSSTRLEYEHAEYEDFTDEETRILDHAVSQFEDKVQEALNGLRGEYDYQTSREAVEETIRINEYEFNERGGLE